TTPVEQSDRSGHHRFNRRWPRHRFQVEDVKLVQDPILMENQAMYHRVIIEGPGGTDDLRVIESGVAALKENEVRIAVRAFSLNFADLLCLRGLYPTMPPYPFTPGFEASGVVVSTGSAVTSVRRGDSVIVG